jgi:hypothetical protein
MSARPLTKDELYQSIEEIAVECFGPGGLQTLAEAIARSQRVDAALSGRMAKPQMADVIRELLQALNTEYELSKKLDARVTALCRELDDIKTGAGA